MDITVQKLLDDLGTISKIGINDKLGTSSESLDIQKEGLRQSLERAFYGDKRSKSISYIFNTVNTTITIITLLMESEHMKSTSNSKYQTRYQYTYSLLTALGRARKGLGNLLVTYHSGGLLKIDLTEMMGKIESFIKLCGSTTGISLDEQ